MFVECKKLCSSLKKVKLLLEIQVPIRYEPKAPMKSLKEDIV